MATTSMKLFDSHFHIIDPRFPLVANNGYLPEAFTCDDYLERMQRYDLRGGAIVSGSFQGFDQSYLVEALQLLGSAFIGVTQLPFTVVDEEILKLHNAGVRAVRFNLKRGGSENITHMEAMASRVYELCGWHVELFVESGDLNDLYKRLVNLPAFSIDHLGLTKNGFDTQLKLVEKGARVKASGFGRVDFDVIKALKCIYSINPAALMFATDLPSTRALRAYSDDDFSLVTENFNSSDVENILFNNAVAFYKPERA